MSSEMLDILVSFVFQTGLPCIWWAFFADTVLVAVGHAGTAACLKNFVFNNVDIIEGTVDSGLAIQLNKVAAGISDRAIIAIVSG